MQLIIDDPFSLIGRKKLKKGEENGGICGGWDRQTVFAN